MVGCSVVGCKSNTIRKIEGISFHTFPNDPEIRKLWITATNKQNWDPPLGSRICSEHFNKENVLNHGKKTFLKPNSVPVKIENDMANYMEYKLMGSVKQIRMKPKAVPSRFKRRPDHPHKNIERNEIVENTYCIATSLYVRPGAKLMTGTEDYENETNTKHIPKQCNIFYCICGETFSCVTSMDEHSKLYKHFRVSSGKRDVTKATPAVKFKKNSINREKAIHPSKKIIYPCDIKEKTQYKLKKNSINKEKAIHPSKNIIYPCDIKEKTQDNSRTENKYLTEAVPVRNKKEKDEIAASEFILPDVFIKQEIIEEISNNKAEDDEIAASQKEKEKIVASEFILPDVSIKQEIIEEISNNKAEDDEIAASQKEKDKIAASEFILPDVLIEQELIEEISNNKAEDDEIAASQKEKDKIAASEFIIPDVFIKQEIIEEISNKKAEDDEIPASQLTKPSVFIEHEKDDEKVASEMPIPSIFINQEIIEECLIKKEKDDEILTSELIIPPEIIKQEIEDEYTQPILKRKKLYKKYDEDVIEEALKEYEESKKSFKVIADKHNISKSVLQRHCIRFMKKQGGKTALSQETEKYIIKYLNICSEWGYPLDAYDLRLLVKDYLDRIGITVKKFKDNMPGPDFVTSFLIRNKQDISLRLSQNFNRVRAAVSPEIINQYFDELGLSLDGVPLCNLVNYDETNLSDDPGRRKNICKRGAKYPERIMNHNKGSISLMMAAAADGTLLPPYVVYKSQHLYDTWTTGGPKGCIYNRTDSGWFDGHTFEEWMRTVIYSHFKDKTGKKLLIGDNLSSHLSIDLIRECKERDIHFVFLPSYSTHLTQPLDVAFFRPMKIAWRDILFHWKKTDGRVQDTLPKPLFPQLLKKLLQRLDDNAKQNILSGFSKAGISPLNRKIVLDRLPNNYERDDSIFSKESVDETVY